MSERTTLDDAWRWFQSNRAHTTAAAYDHVSTLIQYVQQLQWDAYHHLCPKCDQECTAAEREDALRQKRETAADGVDGFPW